MRASVVVAHGLSSCGTWAIEHRLSSCGTWALLLGGMWDLPGPGFEPVSPALADGFLTTVSPGKPYFNKFFKKIFIYSFIWLHLILVVAGRLFFFLFSLMKNIFNNNKDLFIYVTII